MGGQKRSIGYFGMEANPGEPRWLAISGIFRSGSGQSLSGGGMWRNWTWATSLVRYIKIECLTLCCMCVRERGKEIKRESVYHYAVCV